MGQKINPVCLRLHYTNRHFDSCWYSNYFYKNLITQDILLQHYLNNFLKLLKLPAGRYSIQHLQKKTQIFNFLCYSKSTREWRSKVFGLLKKNNSKKKTRYFFKTAFRKKIKKYSKLTNFYTTLNQIAVHKIQKKMTSFQNFQLWSALNRVSKHKVSFQNKQNFLVVNQINSNKIKNPNVLHSSALEKTIFLSPLPLIKKTRIENQNSRLNSSLLKNEILPKKITENPVLQSSNFKEFKVKKIVHNSWLLFLQNLVIYKTLKSNLNPNKNLSFKAIDLKYKNYLDSYLTKFYKSEIELIPFTVKNDWQHANYLADEIVYFLEKRIPFRRLKSKILKELSKNSAIRGVRITCSGRVGGKSKKAQRAKMECIKYGETSLQVFSSKIDFSIKTAFTSFGSVGVKVWICYN